MNPPNEPKWKVVIDKKFQRDLKRKQIKKYMNKSNDKPIRTRHQLPIEDNYYNI